jgi:hypothetical protein
MRNPSVRSIALIALSALLLVMMAMNLLPAGAASVQSPAGAVPHSPDALTAGQFAAIQGGNQLLLSYMPQMLYLPLIER